VGTQEEEGAGKGELRWASAGAPQRDFGALSDLPEASSVSVPFCGAARPIAHHHHPIRHSQLRTCVALARTPYKAPAAAAMLSFKAPHTYEDIELESSSHFFVKDVAEIAGDEDAKSYITDVKTALLGGGGGGGRSRGSGDDGGSSGGGGSFVNITEQETFDAAYSVSLVAKCVSGENFKVFAVVLGSAFERLLQAVSSTAVANSLARQSVSQRCGEAFKMLTFLMSLNAHRAIAAIRKESTHTTSTSSTQKRKQEFSQKPEVGGWVVGGGVRE
jgi:hypothetical protein